MDFLRLASDTTLFHDKAVNANIRMLINRGRGYKNLRYLLLKAKRLAVSNLELVAVRRIVKAA